MKYSTRIQPFVAVTRKEADAIQMEDKLANILANKSLNSRAKSRYLEDSIGRMANFKENNNLTADATEEDVPLSRPSRPRERSTPRTPKSRTPRVTNVSKNKRSITRTIPDIAEEGFDQKITTPESLKKSSKTMARKKAVKIPENKGPVLTVDTPRASRRSSILTDENIPSFMRPTKAHLQKGTGGKRLYIKLWK